MRKMQIISIIMTVFGGAIAGADVEMMPPEEVFSKCYARLTDHPVNMDSSIYGKVKNGKEDPIDSCMKFFDTAMFDADTNRLKTTNELSKAILRNFQQFHQSWFTIPLGTGVPSRGAWPLIDQTEPSLYITNALFANLPYKYVTTSNKSIRGVRQNGIPNPYYVDVTNFSETKLIVYPMDNLGTRDPKTLVEVIQGNRVTLGPLIGIESTPAYNLKLPIGYYSPTPLNTEELLRTKKYTERRYNLTQHHGGGIIGSNTWLLNNSEGRAHDGGLYVFRRGANNFFYDLMCSKLPSLRDTDVPVTREYNDFKKRKSGLSFRTSKTCLACHTTLDNFAHAQRNLVTHDMSASNSQNTRLRESGFGSFIYPSTALEFEPTKPAIPHVDIDEIYHRRKPEGSLTYRDYDDKLIDIPVNGTKELGTAVARQNDIYVCAAKRYYHFLTGLDISLEKIEMDGGKPANPRDAFAFHHRQQIINLGKKLKAGKDGSGKTYNLREMMQEIMHTEAFQARNPAQVGDQP